MPRTLDIPFAKRAFDQAVNVHWAATSRALNFQPMAHRMLFADPRGGSTWLAETLQSGLAVEMLWEPLQLRLVDEFNRLNFSWRQYIPDDADWPEARAAFEDLFGGRILNNHICRYTAPWRLATQSNVFIKFCRANAMLPWLTQQFAFEHQPVLLIRHPFAVAASQMNFGKWEDVRYTFDPAAPFAEHEAPHAEFLTGLRSRPELLVGRWCLHNASTLRHERDDQDWVTVYYEHLIRDPEAELTRIFDRWQLPMPPRVLEQVRKPSKMTRDATFTHSIEDQLVKWRSKFNADDLRNMQAVLDHFGVEIYGDAAFPSLS